jgi:RNA polymerase sigma-70 factor (ECF subfamily)
MSISMDIVQNVFLEFWQKKNSIEIKTSLKSYLYQVVRNKSIDYVKSTLTTDLEKSKLILELKDIEAHYYTENSEMIEKQKLEIIYKEIDKLPKNYQEIIKLSRIEGLKNREISEKLNISIRTVETSIFRALKMIKSSIKDKDLYWVLL